MGMGFSRKIYRGYLIKGNLIGAMNYVKLFPEQAALYDRFLEIFEQKKYITYEIEDTLNEILGVYQRYYRSVFYIHIDKDSAEKRLKSELMHCLGISNDSIELCDLEENQLVEVFRRSGLYFMGGKTSGYYGPYVWRTTETKVYEVQLPDGIQTYQVKLLDGFIARSWMDYLSFGEIGTGGWTDRDGIINCVRSAYDLESEDFKVSLLKHEAQHAWDLSIRKDMSSEDLEYRAKLVELIYSSERNLLEQFVQEGNNSDNANGHASASGKIIEGFARKLNLSCEEIERLPNRQVQDVAWMLFEESRL